jgi:hypothetical protein
MAEGKLVGEFVDTGQGPARVGTNSFRFWCRTHDKPLRGEPFMSVVQGDVYCIDLSEMYCPDEPLEDDKPADDWAIYEVEDPTNGR